MLDGSSSSCPTPTAIVAKRSEIIVEMFDLAATASSELPVTMETTTVMFGGGGTGNNNRFLPLRGSARGCSVTRISWLGDVAFVEYLSGMGYMWVKVEGGVERVGPRDCVWDE